MLKLLGRVVGVAVAATVIAVLLAIYVGLLEYSRLPSLEPLINYHPHLPLRVYTDDGALIGEFGEERRTPVKIDDVPVRLREAILAAEDDHFYQHDGAIRALVGGFDLSRNSFNHVLLSLAIRPCQTEA